MLPCFYQAALPPIPMKTGTEGFVSNDHSTPIAGDKTPTSDQPLAPISELRNVVAGWTY
jgi:hypothetical protein